MPGKNSKKSVGGRTNNNNSTAQPVTNALPSWPALTPVLPPIDLSIEERIKEQILIIHNLLTSTLSKTLVSFLSTLPLTTTPGKPKRGEATRVNDRYQVIDPAFAHRLWSQTALQTLVKDYSAEPSIFGGEILGLNPNIRVYRYTKGQFFDKHYDESNNVAFAQTSEDVASNQSNTIVAGKTTWTLLIYLSTCEGGETIFYPEPKSRKEKTPDPVVCETEVGMALLHRHGGDCMLHEGAEVKGGEKWVLRSDLVVRR